MVKTAQLRWLVWVAFMVIASFSAVAWRLVDLQVLEAGDVMDSTEEVVPRRKVVEALRGSIYDRNHLRLAYSTATVRLGADPSCIHPYELPVSTTIAQALDLDFDYVYSRLTQTNRQWVTLDPDCTWTDWVDLNNAMAELQLIPEGEKPDNKKIQFVNRVRSQSIYFDELSQERVYPYGQTGAQVVGYYHNASLSEGVESRMDRALRGLDGWIEYGIGKNRQSIRRQQDPQVGMDVQLTIDISVQDLLERAVRQGYDQLNPKSISATVMNVHTGEIIAMGTYPGFDPNHITRETQKHIPNQSLVAEFEPGSTFKIVAWSAALNEGLVNLDTIILPDERTVYPHPSGLIRDDHVIGPADVRTALAKSSNIAAHFLAEKVGMQRYYEYVNLFGFGERPGTGLREEDGKVAPLSQWKTTSSMRAVPMGYEVSVTQLQLVAAYSALANGGTLLQPRIILKATDRNGKEWQSARTVVRDGFLSASTVSQMMEALTMVTQPGGTATRADMENHFVAGKTATARKYHPVHGYDHRLYYDATFVGVFPATRPEYCVAVTVHEPDTTKPGVSIYGGAASAPIFLEIAEGIADLYSIPPDKPLAEIAGRSSSTEPASLAQTHTP